MKHQKKCENAQLIVPEANSRVQAQPQKITPGPRRQGQTEGRHTGQEFQGRLAEAEHTVEPHHLKEKGSQIQE